MCVQLTSEDIRTLAEVSKKVMHRLPEEGRLARMATLSPRHEMAVHYIRKGSLAIRLFVDEFEMGQLDSESACVLRSVLVESELMLGQLIAEISPRQGSSCIGTCTGEKKKCKDDCKQKYCGCGWNAFLCKANCFIKINVGSTDG